MFLIKRLYTNYQRLALTRLLLCLTLLLVSACSYFSPEYQRPEAPMKKSWVRHVPEQVTAAETIRPDWWANFGDPTLDELVKIAIAQNFDLKVLAARTRIADAAISQINATRLPTIEAAAGAPHEQIPGRDVHRSYNWAAALSWETDIWGRIEQGVRAQQAAMHATEADWRAGYLVIVSDLAGTYFQLRLLDEQILQQKSALAANQRILKILRAMLKEGMIPETTVLQQGAEVDQFKRDLMELVRFRDLTENSLATILGVPAGDFQLPPGQLTKVVHQVDLPLGLPMNLLLRRPDIIAAEYRVLQAHDLVGKARRGLLPTATITGKGGLSSIRLTQLSEAFSYGVDPSIDLPFLNPNAYARINITEAQVDLVKEEYRRIVIRAFEEVENALVNLASHRNQKKELQARREKLLTVAGQIRAQLQEGVVSQLQVLETERSLIAAELQLLRNHQDILVSTIELYKALGGGWPAQKVGDAS